MLILVVQVQYGLASTFGTSVVTFRSNFKHTLVQCSKIYWTNSVECFKKIRKIRHRGLLSGLSLLQMKIYIRYLSDFLQNDVLLLLRRIVQNDMYADYLRYVSNINII